MVRFRGGVVDGMVVVGGRGGAGWIVGNEPGPEDFLGDKDEEEALVVIVVVVAFLGL
jgi:hypothetical protein